MPTRPIGSGCLPVGCGAGCSTPRRRGRPDDASVPVDGEHFDGVVSVAQPVPRWDVGLPVSGGVGRPGAQGVTSDVVAVPDERPVLPLVGTARRVQLRWVPVTFAGEADVDLCDR